MPAHPRHATRRHRQAPVPATKLCLTRIFVKHYCLLGKQSGQSISIGALTAVDCVQSRYDRTRYWSWLVDGGRALLCTTIYHS